MNILRFLALGDKKLSPFNITHRFTHLFWLGDLNYRVDLPTWVRSCPPGERTVHLGKGPPAWEGAAHLGKEWFTWGKGHPPGEGAAHLGLGLGLHGTEAPLS